MSFWHTIKNTIAKTNPVQKTENVKDINRNRLQIELKNKELEIKQLEERFTELEKEIDFLYSSSERVDKTVAQKSIEFFSMSQSLNTMREEHYQLSQQLDALHEAPEEPI